MAAAKAKVNINFASFIWQKINRKIVWLVLAIILAALGVYLLRGQIVSLKNKIFLPANNAVVTTTDNNSNADSQAATDIAGNEDSELIDLSFSEGASSSSTPTSTDGLINEPEKIIIYLIVKDTPTGWLNLRENPSKNAKILTQVNSGDKFEATEKQEIAGDEYSWYKILVDENISGWIYGQYITEIEG
jgi:hypothetical protein